MRTADLAELFRRSRALRAEIPVGLQCGVPMFGERDGELFARYMPHTMSAAEDGILFGAPRFEVEMVWPFSHVVLLRRIPCLPGAGSRAVLTVPRDGIAAVKREIQAYFAVGDRLLEARGKTGRVDPELLRECEKAWRSCLDVTGLAAVYGGAGHGA